MVLYVNACVRGESRTERLARSLISKFEESVEEVVLEDIAFPKVDEEFLKRRDSFVGEGDYSDPMFDFAKSFAEADVIVIAAPFWDLSFPALLKIYLEQINVLGLTFIYTEKGIPQGLCRADRLYYVTTAGGKIDFPEFGYGYVRALAQNFYGIKNVEMIAAEGLDIVGVNVEERLRECEKRIASKKI